MKTLHTTPVRAIPPIPGGGSWAFDEEQWMWIPNDPAIAHEPAAAGNEQAAAAATDQE